MKISQLLNSLKEGQFDQKMIELYGENELSAQKERYDVILNHGLQQFGDLEGMLISAPGRTEVGGNHTDHQLGCVLAASLNLDCVAIVIPTDDNTVSYYADGFHVQPVDLDDLGIHSDEKNTTEALIRGVAAGLAKNHYQYGGFKAYCDSEVLAGGGMSSSAAFEVLLGTIQNVLYNKNQVSAEDIAKIGQYAENTYFMKPSGLLDQMACSVGSFAFIDFADVDHPMVEKVPFDPSDYGYDLVLTDVRASHADLSDEYGTIPQEMKSVANSLNRDVLGQTTMNELMDSIQVIRETCGDRAFLRAFHYINETQRAKDEAEALKNKDITTFLKLVRESGRSSYMYLQNINVPGETKKQPIAIALALSEAILKEDGAYRVHGGGFAGTIQAFVKKETTSEYIETMEHAFGKDCCYVLRIRNCGGIKFA